MDSPDRTLEHVRLALAERYGIQATLSQLSGENHNFRADRASGAPVVVKVIDVAAAPSIGLEQALVRHLQQAAFPVGLPIAVPPIDGGVPPTIPLPGGQPGRVHVVRFVEGTPWNELDQPDAGLAQATGRTLAELHSALEGFTHPAGGRTHLWDLANAHRLRDRVAAIPAGDDRLLVERALTDFNAVARPLLAACPRGIIHGDLNDENVLVAGAAVAGLIDFGDALENPLVCDLAIAVAYLTLGSSDPLTLGAAIVAGYESVRRLQPAERDALGALVRARLAVSVVVAAGRRAAGEDRPSLFVSERAAWAGLRLLDTIPADERTLRLFPGEPGMHTADDAQTESLLAARKKLIGGGLSLSYQRPLHFVKGRAQYLFDPHGEAHLDLVNNVCHVGHCHPRVVAAARHQMGELNTNSRYLYHELTGYAERLAALLPEPLSVCYIVNSGSEANELAVRLARTHTGRRGMVVVDGAYHGHTSTLIALSPYKFMGRGGPGRAEPWVQIAAMPDVYRGPHRGADAGERYAADVARAIGEADVPVAGFMVESLLSCGGQIPLPDGYLAAAFAHARAAGAVAIADEVQVGFGRVGEHLWGFELQGVVPDIVVMGKPIGNGHPLAAVVTTPEIAASFDNGMEFFSTFGGNPVSCAIGTAVLDVIEDEGLQDRAHNLGAQFLNGLRQLQERHSLIGDVRGRGLFLGMELVRDRETLEPADTEATALVETLRERGILLSTDGPLHNVIKIKPPMVLDEGDIQMTLRALDETLATLGR